MKKHSFVFNVLLVVSAVNMIAMDNPNTTKVELKNNSNWKLLVEWQEENDEFTYARTIEAKSDASSEKNKSLLQFSRHNLAKVAFKRRGKGWGVGAKKFELELNEDAHKDKHLLIEIKEKNLNGFSVGGMMPWGPNYTYTDTISNPVPFPFQITTFGESGLTDVEIAKQVNPEDAYPGVKRVQGRHAFWKRDLKLKQVLGLDKTKEECRENIEAYEHNRDRAMQDLVNKWNPSNFNAPAEQVYAYRVILLADVYYKNDGGNKQFTYAIPENGNDVPELALLKMVEREQETPTEKLEDLTGDTSILSQLNITDQTTYDTFKQGSRQLTGTELDMIAQYFGYECFDGWDILNLQEEDMPTSADKQKRFFNLKARTHAGETVKDILWDKLLVAAMDAIN